LIKKEQRSEILRVCRGRTSRSCVESGTRGSFTEIFDDFVARPEEFVDAGEWVVVRVHMSGRGKRSGAPSEIVFWNAYKLQHSRVVRLESYRGKADALTAAGLPD
jgi:hypothetical protein